MNKKYANKIISVLLGIALITMIFSFVSLIFDAAFMDDVILLNDSDGNTERKLNEIMTFMKWISVSLVCVLVPVFVCYVFAYFGNGKIFNIVSAVLSLFVTAMCIAFICVLRKQALDSKSATIYAAVAESFEAFITLAVTSLLVCAFFIYNSVLSFKAKPENNLSAQSGEVQNDEEV